MTDHQKTSLAELLREHGQTFAAEAGIRLRDKPAALYQVLVLVTLLSKPIGAQLAVAGTRELFAAGYRTPHRMRAASWQDRVDALTRGHYRRFDESTATRLDEQAGWLLDTYCGDLRRLAERAGHRADEAHRLLQDAPGVGPTGASIYLREVQAVWAWLRPYADENVRTAAGHLGLPSSTRGLRELAGSDDLSLVGAAAIRAGS